MVVTQKAGAGDPAPPRRPGAGVAGFAVLTVDAAGLVTSWSVTAARLFGRTAGEITGSAWVWTATAGLAFASTDGLATRRCEPAPGGSPAGLVVFS